MMDLVLKDSTFNEIAEMINEYNGGWNILAHEISSKYSLPLITSRSIVSQRFKRRMKFTFYRVKNQATDLWYRYRIAVNNGEVEGIIIRLAQELGSSPCLVAKLVLKEYVEFNKANKKMPPVMNSPSPEPQDEEEFEIKEKSSIGAMLRDSTLIHDPRLAYEILLCTLNDTMYGYITDVYNRMIGEEYEGRLFQEARKHGLSFQSEKDLRLGGYDKTPDLKLNTPIAVDGFIVNWIESKALFGMTDDHKGYIGAQYSSYWNRFGPGLVIYWFGHVESIADPQEKRFIVRGDFPRNITHTRPMSIAPAQYQGVASSST